MKEIRKQLFDLLADIKAANMSQYSYSGADCTVTGITDDTRRVTQGNIFVCVKGGSFDGHSAAAEMLEKGAAAVVCGHDLGLGNKQIITDDTRKFYGLLTAAWFDHPEKQLILAGVTGTNGKTTLATMIHHILSFMGEKTGLIGTTGALIGNEPVERDDSTPTTPKVFELYKIFREMADKGCKYCVMEVSSFALEQNRIGPAVYECAVFTNLTRDHLDYHGTMENYYLAKKKLFTDHCRLAIVNTEDTYGERLYNEITCPKLSYGIKGGTSVYASYIKYSNGAAKFWYCLPEKSFPVTLNMIGSYNISNACAAIAACSSLGVPMEKITEAMSDFKGVRGRCETIPTGRDFFIICDYAHSPDALENMLPGIKENTEGRLICLFGCGGDRDRTKRPLMARAAAKYADRLIVTSDNPRNEDPDAIIDEIMTGLEGSTIPCDRITDRKKAIFHAVRIAEKGDVIVLAGKGHEDYQILAGNVHIRFDEREICAEALETLNTTKMTLGEIASVCGGICMNIPDPTFETDAKDIFSDSRAVIKGGLFAAYKGGRFDGHDYVKASVEAGAAAALTERTIDNCPCIVTDSTVKSVLKLAAHYRRRFSPVFVGITGSVGKTTTKEMTALALSSEYKTYKTPANRNNEIGMPFSLFELTPEHEAAVIEMGMSHFGEIERLSKTCRPDICIITNIGWSHAENLGSSQDGVLKAKLEILQGAAPNAPLIVSGDDPRLAPLKDKLADRRVITCALENKDADFTAEDISVSDGNTTFTAVRNGIKGESITLPCIGRHHIIDCLFAFAAVYEAAAISGKTYNEKAAAESLSRFEAEGLRQHAEYRNGVNLIIDCYNAAPDSMKAALNVLCSTVTEGRRISVLGDMLELGELSPALHREVGEYAAQNGADLVVCFGENAEHISEGAESEGAASFYSQSKNDIVQCIKENVKSGDTVLFKASRGMHMEEIIRECFGE